jgi:glutaredoxin
MMKPVEIYTKEGCPYTRGLKRKLEHDGLSYVTYDVLKDPTWMQKMLALNEQQREVPTIVWPDKGVEVGFHGT